MFVQIIRGEAADAAALRRQFDRWGDDLRPGAAGFVGATHGVTDDGRFVALACFESAEAAQANSDRPEQAAWWEETAGAFQGVPTFVDCTETDTLLAGPSGDAGFVQVMYAGGPADRSRLRDLDASFEPVAKEFRPDVIGGLRAWHPDGRFTGAVYFTSEQAARAGESQEPPPDFRPMVDEQIALLREAEWLDLREPWLLL
jgi:hypothetical protein